MLAARSLCRAFLAVVASATTAAAATLPAGFSETRIATGLANPTAMTMAPDGRIFICQQGGQLRVVKNGSLLGAPFLTVSVDPSGERGLLGVAFDPAFATNRFVYVYYTVPTAPIHNRVSRFTASATNPDVVTAGSEVPIFDLPNLSSATNHNGGAIHFGPDGKLYVAVGENANSANAPSLNTTLGKVLRINPDGSIPGDNPFIGQTTGQNQAIWARGLRNPFTFAFQPGTGRLHINDVGEGTWEEVNLGAAGANYGWPSTEGPNPPGQAGVTYPTFAFQHTGGVCAIVGGAFYNPATVNFPPEFVGRYFFGDLCAGFIHTLAPPAYNVSANFATGINTIVDLAVGTDGALYYLTRGGGELFRVQLSANAAPQITQQPEDLTVSQGQPATFLVAASGLPTLHYQWQRNMVDIPGATAATFTLPAAGAADDGATFRAIVTNDFGTATSDSATLTVTANTPPQGSIDAPANGTLYRGGDTFSFSGSATDAEDGTLPASAFTWRVDFHHDDHVHPFVPPTTGVTSGSFTIPTRGEVSANVFYQVVLIVRDSQGLTHTTTADLRPRTSVMTLATAPAGLQLTLDGQPVTAPFSVTGVEGVIRALGVVSPQTSGGTVYTFASWSDGGAATHEISTPVADTTFTATFQPAPPTTVFADDFETDLGWVVNPDGTDSVTRGRWERGDPMPTHFGRVGLQLDACADGTSNCLITGLLAGPWAGANDVDKGTTSIQSPAVVLPPSGILSLGFAYYFAHLGNSSADDFFRVSVVGPGGSTAVFEERGSAARDAAAWAAQSVDVSAFAGQTIRIRFEAADNAGASTVEAGADSVVIIRR